MTERVLRRSKRTRPMMESDSCESDVEESVPVVVIDDESGEESKVKVTLKFERRRRSSIQPVKPEVKLAPIFLPRKEREPKERIVQMAQMPQMNARQISEATKNFLYSGVPESIARTQQIITKNQIAIDLLETHEVFPRLTHVNSFSGISALSPFAQSSLRCAPVEFSPGEYKPGLPPRTACGTDTKSNVHFCCKQLQKPSKALRDILNRAKQSNNIDPIPWVTKYQLYKHEYLAVDKEAQTTFKNWVKQWNRDIRDDGGASRKIIKKRRKTQDNDLDFIDDGSDDGDHKHKSVVLVGPPGSAKSTMVYVLAKRFKFKVLEVNFSSRRCGQEVLRRVEEATLSRRLSTATGVDKKHCLLLFRDVDQLFPEEDEGFYGALSQLISASLRPIVMTISTYSPEPIIDSKIERKEPLWIEIRPASSDIIISKVLFPIIKREILQLDIIHDYELDEAPEDFKYIQQVLRAVVRHCKFDIKRSINQTQVLWQTSNFSLEDVHGYLCSAVETDLITSDFDCCASDFPSKIGTNQGDLDSIAYNFKFITDLDCLSNSKLSDPENDSLPHTLQTYFDANFESMLESVSQQPAVKRKGRGRPRKKSTIPSIPYIPNLFRDLMLKTQSEEVELQKMGNLHDEVVKKYLEKEGVGDYYDEAAYFRTILKSNIINSIGGDKRRNGRLRYHFSNIGGRDVIDPLCDNFDFRKNLEVCNQVGAAVGD